jgi:hypothetical protein
MLVNGHIQRMGSALEWLVANGLLGHGRKRIHLEEPMRFNMDDEDIAQNLHRLEMLLISSRGRIIDPKITLRIDDMYDRRIATSSVTPILRLMQMLRYLSSK